ncbi:MAG TPA: stage II sporulation protein D [Clostridia bacterium]
MKKAGFFYVFMVILILILPLIIVKGCGHHLGPSGKPGKVKINVYLHLQNKICQMDLEDYTICVVAAEMPAEFDPEALKAQAVAARTYAYSRLKKMYVPSESIHPYADVCSDPGHCQAFISREDAMKKWGSQAKTMWSKISKAVYDTRGIIIYYDGNVVNPLFHSNSGGKTEDIEDVWGGTTVPYLRSVKSPGEESESDYESVKSIKTNEFVSLLKEHFKGLKIDEKDPLESIKIIDYTAGGRIRNIKVGNMNLKGTDIRSALSLKSANFKIEKSGKDALKITARGNGHGVGMSQAGANYLAKKGKSFEQILKYYYKGVNLGGL